MSKLTRPERGPRWLWGVPFDTQRNSLNLLRLILAAMVIVAHSFYTGGFGIGPVFRGENLGGWAVIGFFALSGFLITGSRLGRSFGDYLTHRIARLYPAFIVCLLFTIVICAPVSYFISTTGASLRGFLTTGPTPPLGYIVHNFTLKMNVYDVAGTPLEVPYPGAWDGSLWTLYYEFLCYLVVGMAFCWGITRKHPRITVSLLFAFSVFARWLSSHVQTLVGGSDDVTHMAKLLPVFLGGALLWVFREKIRFGLVGAVVAAMTAIGLIWFLPDVGIQLASPLMGYVLLWLGMVLPVPEIIRREDISYGIYIYGFIAEQLLALLGAHHLGLIPYTGLSIVATIPFAAASWIFVEKPAMARVKGRVAYPWLSRMRPSRLG